MKINIRNAEEYIAVYLGICGEIDQDRVLSLPPLSRGSIYRGIKNLREMRVLNRHRYADGTTFLRLSSVNGGKYLEAIAPALAANARSIIGEELKYSGNNISRLRERANSTFYLNLLENGISVNGLTCDYKPGDLFQKSAASAEGESFFSDSYKPLRFETIVDRIGPEYTGYFTKRIVKEREDDMITHKGSRISRISGTLFLFGQVYQTYVLEDPYSAAWKAEAEFNASNYVIGTLEKNSGSIRHENKCILFYQNPESAEKMLLQDEKRTPRIDPCNIYDTSYVIPSYKIEKAYMELLSTPDWKTKATRLLFPGTEQNGPADAITPDGMEVYNFMLCDLNRIRSMMPRILNADGSIVLLVEAWMSGAMHGIFDNKNVEIVEISSDELRVLSKEIALGEAAADKM